MNHIAHFAINSDDLPGTRAFYEQVFGWKFQAWGPPNFFMIETGEAAPGPVIGSLQKRRQIVPGKDTYGYECTIAVKSVDATAELVEKNGGRIVMQRATISHVGHLIFFQDPGGNIAGAMEYDSNAE